MKYTRNMTEGGDPLMDTLLLATSIPVLLIGTVGNCLTLCVLCRAVYRNKSFTVFLRALAVADTITLWVDPTTVQLLDPGYWERVPEAQCTLYTWVVNLTNIASSWTLVLVTLERVIIIYHPHQANILCTKRAALGLVVGIWVLWGLVGTYIIAHGPTEDIICFIDDTVFHQRALTIFLVLYSVVPASLIITCNILILVALHKAKINRHRMTAGASSAQNQKLTVMLLTTSCMFVLLTLPEALIFVVDASNGFSYLYTESWLDIAIPLSDVLRRLNHAINFLLYCVSGAMFRRELKYMFLEVVLRSKQHQQRQHSRSQTHSMSMSMSLAAVGGKDGGDRLKGANSGHKGGILINPMPSTEL